MIDMIAGSSSIHSIHFNKDKQTLHVQFQNGGVGYYLNITTAIYNRLMQAESKGSFLSKYIKSQPERFPYRKVGPGPLSSIIESTESSDKNNVKKTTSK